MTPDQLRKAIAEIYGPNGQRTMARYLSSRGIVRDEDGSRLRRMVLGSRPILPEVVTAVEAKLAETRAVRSEQTRLERLIARTRDAFPRASLVYAQILLRLERGETTLRDLGLELDDDPDSSTVHQTVLRLEEIGLIEIDRGETRQSGFSLSLSPAARAG